MPLSDIYPRVSDVFCPAPGSLPTEANRAYADTGDLRESALPSGVVTKLLHRSGTLAIKTDLDGKILAVSDNAIEMLGYSKATLLQCSLVDFVYEQDKEGLQRALAMGKEGESAPSVLQFAKGVSEGVCLQLRIFAETSSDGAEPYLIVFGHDVTEWMRANDQLAQRTLLDPVTGLGNRGLMKGAVREAIRQAVKSSSGLAVAVLNIDGFRKVNDSLGRDVGDELLRAVGERITSVLGGADCAARLGGDDFALLMPGVRTDSEAQSIANRMLAAIRQPFRLSGHRLHMSSSVGIAIYPQHGNDDAALLRHADAAMDRAKEDGKNAVRIYTDDLGVQNDRAISVEQNMFEAIRDGEFTLQYQPICDTATREVCAVEALMRWTHKNRMVSPVDFIPVAEENGLIHMLGAWALRATVMQLARWDALGMRLQYATVNVSPVQFLHPTFPENVEKALADSGISPERLVLEITESSLMRQPEKARAILDEIKQLGVRFAIDDFGTGYSNLGNLKRFPLTCLKIDRSFVMGTPSDPDDCAIVSLVLALAHELGLAAVAEGVETDEQRTFLLDNGCAMIQGWLVSKAVPPDTFEQQVRSGALKLRDTTISQTIPA